MGKLSERSLTRRQIEGMIADGKAVFLYKGEVMSVNAWMPYHPGGDTAIKHMIGRDATDEVFALHSEDAKRRMKSYIIGKYDGAWENFLPPIKGGVFRKYNGPEDDEEERLRMRLDLDAASDSTPSSPTLSATSSSEDSFPLLDPSLRRRRVESSSSSVTTVEDETEVPPGHFDGDYLTRQYIEADLAKYPSLQNATQKEIAQKYRDLEVRIRAAGLYKCNYWAYAKECTRYAFLFASSMWCLRNGWYKTSAFFMGAFWHQLVFSAHDAGHMGITHNFQVDTVLGIIIANFLGGLSIGWWKRSHNVHHIVTNDPEHDPDIEHLPFFAVSHRFFGSIFSSYYQRYMPYDAFARFFVPMQHYLYYPILLFGRFNLYFLSFEYLFKGLGPRKGPAAWHRYLELAGLVVFWYWFGYGVVYKGIPNGWDRFSFIMISHMVTMPLHVQITLSHFAMSTADLGTTESFAQRMLRTTMDVDCSEWLDWFHGGLHLQAIHHLFPRIPRHNLRPTQKLVMEFCKDVGIPYAIYGFYRGNEEIIGRLAEVARQAKLLAECQKVMQEKGEFGGF
ncbi:fatty acid desaturase-domain-containing protein [Pyronema domesticum]|uniref:Delta 8-(E)-sphingolipid desaturase n=1 Tax=Pyronema omphalodes (strain CBS 100304) TaxID=1076935 RepID=U4LM89_PYROM|nr:fatty acid desaturase-domain-containing protein [Pyronema domesticum]CCX33249.1 Similar to Fatty acid desaturase 1; acc. no. O60427 [Pyronema omphalodes CBS 100304]